MKTVDMPHEAKQRRIFRVLVKLQGAGQPAAELRQTIRGKYRLTKEQLDSIEEAGIACCWPPLVEE